MAARRSRATLLLEEIRELVLQAPELDGTDVECLVEAIEKLDNHLTGGGPLPDQWAIIRKSDE